MVKIRLQRVGKRNRPYYRVVVTDARNPRSGKVLDIIGHYDPLREEDLEIKFDRLEEWLRKGAQLTPRVDSLIRLLKRRKSVAEAAAVSEESSDEPTPNNTEEVSHGAEGTH